MKCKICGIKQHVICELHVNFASDPFYCKSCRAVEDIVHVPIRARNLPTTACDRHITNFLASQRVNENSSIVIRLLSEGEKYLPVKEIFTAYRPDKGYTFKNCTLFGFFDTGHNSDICFFSVHFQLYGLDKTCPKPNRKTAYISYVDSVQLLPVPSESRTKIYRLILLGLFDYFKSIGYKKILLWSCPPRKQNDDYIFYVKPPHMKMPAQVRLSLWYKDLLTLGVKLNVIDGFAGFHDHANTNGWSDLKNIPYVAGDNWVTRMEEAVKAVENEKKRLATGVMNVQTQLYNTEKSSKKALILAGKLKELDEKGRVFNADEMIRKRMEVQFEGFNNAYFVIYLSAENPVVAQPEPVLDRPWLNNRHDFVDYFWANMFEFSSERRAQYSTLMMLHRIFAESKLCIFGCQRSGNISVSSKRANLLSISNETSFRTLCCARIAARDCTTAVMTSTIYRGEQALMLFRRLFRWLLQGRPRRNQDTAHRHKEAPHMEATTRLMSSRRSTDFALFNTINAIYLLAIT